MTALLHTDLCLHCVIWSIMIITMFSARLALSNVERSVQSAPMSNDFCKTHNYHPSTGCHMVPSTTWAICVLATASTWHIYNHAIAWWTTNEPPMNHICHNHSTHTKLSPGPKLMHVLSLTRTEPTLLWNLQHAHTSNLLLHKSWTTDEPQHDILNQLPNHNTTTEP